MDPLPWGAAFDISSDEEPTALEDSRAYHDDNDDYNWLTRLLESVDKVKQLSESEKDSSAATVADVVVVEDDDDDEVVVVGEYNPPKSKANSKPWKQMKHEDDDDDDCVVLDGDPDKPVPDANNHSATTRNDDGGCFSDTAVVDDDDLLVVGEKGQVACRDYPHPRHLCVEFPFNSTPHEKRCHLCHCYVCDLVAPCVQWGTGMSLIDHCHATDKQEMWKTQREIFRIGKFPSSTPPTTLTQLNQVASRDVLQSTTNSSSRIQVNRLQRQAFRPSTTRACSSSSRMGIPNSLLVSSQGLNGAMTHSVSRPFLGVRNKPIRHDRNPTISNFVQRTSSNTISRSPGVTGGVLAIDETVYGSLNSASCHPVSNYTRNAVSLDILKEVPSSRQDNLPNVTAGSYISSQPNIGSAVLDTAISRSEVYSQSITPPISNQHVHQLGNQGHTVTGSTLPPLDFSWVDLLGTSDHQQTSLGGIQLQGTGSSYEPSAVRQFSSQIAGAGTTQFQYDIEGYNNCFGNQDVSVVSDACSHDLDFIPPETPAVDAGIITYCRRAKSRN